MIFKFFWLLASGYLLFNFFKPLPPFKRRRWVIFWLLIVQAVSLGVGAALYAPKSDGPAIAPVHDAQAPANATPEPDIDKLIVHTDPNAPEKPPSAAARKDAHEAREEVRALMPNLDASFLLLKHGMETGSPQEVQMAEIETRKIEMTLDSHRPGMDAEPWPERDDDGYSACTTAADQLSEFASSARRPVSVEEVKKRLEIQDRFHAAYAKCDRWLGR